MVGADGFMFMFSPSCILWDQSLAVVYAVSDLSLEVFCGVFWYRFKLVSVYEVLNFGIVLFS